MALAGVVVELPMFGRGSVELNPRKFWSWFASEAQGISNALEALQRGEADAEWAICAINDRIRRFDNTLEADVVLTLEGACQMTILGEPRSVSLLLDAAPRLPGWRFSTRAALTDPRRVPFRTAPRPSLDVLAGPISDVYDAYAH
ncbi:MAG: hypothetical protein EON61_24650 [Alphaproteobacteria bacterium]|nr:MAG: hypothetical protein EON61_24650 [Alphaproteobacteria bacterium]